MLCQELMKQGIQNGKKTCKFKCRLEETVCNNKQRWNKDKCRYQCKVLINKGICDKRFIGNLTSSECEKMC